MTAVSEIYEFVKHDVKSDENDLVVDFHFTPETTQQEAIEIVDKLVQLADNNEKFDKLTGHSPTLYAVSQFREDLTDE